MRINTMYQELQRDQQLNDSKKFNSKKPVKERSKKPHRQPIKTSLKMVELMI